MAYEKIGLGNTEHSVIITNVEKGTYNWDVYFDAIDINSGGSLLPYNSSPTPTNTPLPAQIGEPLTSPQAGWVRYDDRDTNLYFEGFSTFNEIPYYSGTAMISSITNSKIKFNFAGNKLRLMFLLASGCSKNMKISIDGVEEYFVLQNSNYYYQGLAYEKVGLSNTEHSVIITNIEKGTYNWDVYFDAIDINTGGSLLPFNATP